MRKTFRCTLAAAAFLGTRLASADVLETVDDNPMATIAPNEAAVYFIRPATMGLAIHFWSFVDEMPAGVTNGSTYNWIAVPAGEHLVWSSSGNVSAVKMKLDPGKSYYFEQKVRMGGLRARVELVPLTEAEAKDAFATCAYAMFTPEGAATAKERLAEHHAEAVQAAAAQP